jgi:2-dehydropantoate 2-reductase
MTNDKVLNITIFGSGAMATLFGSKLTAVANVTLFGSWLEQVETIQRNGLTVIQPDGRQLQVELSITNNLAQVPPADIALILVKSGKTGHAARHAARNLKPDGIAITLQNGLGNLEILAASVGPQRAVQGVTAQGATLLAPGRLHHAGQGETYLAQLDGQHPRLQAIASLFNQAGLPTTITNEVKGLVWGKLAINAGINPLTALLNVPNGALVEDEALREIMTSAASEVAQLAAAQGIQLPFDDAAARTVEVSRATAANRSSMLQDMSRAAPTEIDTISGAIVQIGQQLGIPTPVNRQLLEFVKAKEAGLFLDLGLPEQLQLLQPA